MVVSVALRPHKGECASGAPIAPDTTCHGANRLYLRSYGPQCQPLADAARPGQPRSGDAPPVSVQECWGIPHFSRGITRKPIAGSLPPINKLSVYGWKAPPATLECGNSGRGPGLATSDSERQINREPNDAATKGIHSRRTAGSDGHSGRPGGHCCARRQRDQ